MYITAGKISSETLQFWNNDNKVPIVQAVIYKWLHILLKILCNDKKKKKLIGIIPFAICVLKDNDSIAVMIVFNNNKKLLCSLVMI